MKISQREIGPDQPPFIVAEVGANHGGDLGRALSLIDAAKQCGADAVKFQAYEADTITINCARSGFLIQDGPWAGQNLYDLYKSCETPFWWFKHIDERAKEMGITWFASVFDETSVDLLMRYDVAAIKIASFELIDLPLIRYAAKTGKPMILSTGMASPPEIEEALFTCRDADKALLHCVSGYPTPPGEANLDRLLTLQFLCGRVGLSDHTTGITMPIAAAAMGACIIEKHFTLNHKHHPSPDALFSIGPIPFKAMAEAVRETWAAMQKGSALAEDASRPLRRSLYVVADVRTGEFFTHTNVRSIRPGAGLHPGAIDDVIGKIAARDIPRGSPLARDMISDLRS